MKQLFTLLLAASVATPLLAQKPKFTPDHGALLDGKTIVKANLTSPLAKTYSFAVERVLTKGLSLQLGIATMPKSALPLSSTFDKLLNSEDVKISDLRLGSFFFTPELRWYTGGGYGHGFYLMAYYRYQKYNLSGYNHTLEIDSYAPAGAGAMGASSKKTVDVSLQGDLKTNSFGFGFGAQWLLGRNKNIVLDWNILGGHYGTGKLDLTGDIRQTGLSAQEVEDLRKELASSISDIPTVNIAGEKIEIDQQKVALKNISTPWAFFRTSLSIGFRF